jgi:N-acyl-D-aspartate/D-glutamate deacylase
MVELCDVVAEYDGTNLELIIDGCINGFSDGDVEFLARLVSTAGKPLNWNTLSVSANDPEKAPRQLRPSARARQLGAAHVLALTMPVLNINNASFLTFSTIWHLPGWRDVLDRPVPERIAMLRDPNTQAELLKQAKTSHLARFSDFANYRIGDVFTPENERYRDRRVGDIAAELGRDPFPTLIDIVTADELRTVLWPPANGDEDADWAARRELWKNPDVLIGGSDAGAHIDRMLGSNYPTRFLADTLRGRRLVPVERAVQLMTEVPARYFGLRDRGHLGPGFAADVVVFDPERVGSGPPRTVHDLPGGANRLVADSEGIVSVLVNGRQTIAEGHVTGDLPGTLLRSGRDTTDAVR